MSADVDRLKKLITECTEAGNYGDEQTEMMRLLQEAAYELGCYLDTIRAPHEPEGVPAWLKDREAVHVACLKGIIALHPDDALHVGGTSRNELDNLRAAPPPPDSHQPAEQSLGTDVQRDAERYRYMRDNDMTADYCDYIYERLNDPECVEPSELDETIDAARAAAAKEGDL